MKTSTLISQAAANGDVEAVRALLETDPLLIHSHSQDGWTPLHVAAHCGQQEVAAMLLAHGADVDARAHNGLASTPLLWAVTGQHVEAVILLLGHGADVNAASAAGSTPLHKAAVVGNADMARLLLAHGARVNARNSGGQTPLTHALFNGHTEVAALLRQHEGCE